MGKRDTDAKFDKVPDQPIPFSAQESKSPSGAFSKLTREIKDKDLATPAVGRLLLDINFKLEDQVKELSGYKERYHEADKRASVLEEKIHSVDAGAFFKMTGGVGLGFLPTLYSQPSYFALDLILSIVLLLLGFFGQPAIDWFRRSTK